MKRIVQIICALGCALLFVPRSDCFAQGSAAATAPDSSAMRFFLNTILSTKDPRISRAPGDTSLRVFRILYRDADPRWAAYTPDILRALNARILTEQDQKT